MKKRPKPPMCSRVQSERRHFEQVDGHDLDGVVLARAQDRQRRHGQGRLGHVPQNVLLDLPAVEIRQALGLRRLLHLPEPLAKPIFRGRLVDYASPRPYRALGSVPVPQTAGG